MRSLSHVVAAAAATAAAATALAGTLPSPVAAAAPCGALLPPILASCTPEAGTINAAACCAALSPWNEAGCWCDPVAYGALTAVAKNDAAYGWRAGDCAAIGTPFLPPRVGGSFRFAARDTCGARSKPAPVAASGAGCAAGGARGAALRAARLASVGAALAPAVSSVSAVDAWMAGLNSVLAPNVTFTPVGLGYYTGRADVKRALVAAQPVAGEDVVPYAPSAAAVDGGRAFWATPDAVSVPVAAAAGSPGRVSAAFATYEACSARLTSLSLLTPSVTNLYNQFVYFDERDLVSQLDRSPASWCTAIAAACTGADYPYPSAAACRSTYAGLVAAGRVVCARTGGPFVPQNGTVGDSVACRARYLALATAGVAVPSSCAALGRASAAARCAVGACPGRLYVDVFKAPNPRFLGSSAFTCNTARRVCTEAWK